MPGRDRTGPFGAGSMTGRGMGFCAGYSTMQDCTNSGQGIWGRLNRLIQNRRHIETLPDRTWNAPPRGQGIYGRGLGFGRGRGYGLLRENRRRF
ncbi:MAG: DUF5320 domain-containing protein [Syntrophales bacterium]|nr:DUF5320 domain-containing protein [Syntrophales bacterium]MDY0043132.1 DUF5320 domain-containing protein [Syntrophales bacterium]